MNECRIRCLRDELGGEEEKQQAISEAKHLFGRVSWSPLFYFISAVVQHAPTSCPRMTGSFRMGGTDLRIHLMCCMA